MEKKFKINGMTCNSCATLIEKSLEKKVDNVKVSYSNSNAKISYDPKKISEEEIKKIIKDKGYSVEENKGKIFNSDRIGWIAVGVSIALLMFLLYFFVLRHINMPNMNPGELGENASLFLLFFIGILTGFHCVSMCGGFVVSYTAKNAVNGNKGFKQHLVYGGSKVISYAIIGGIFGLIGGVIAFSTQLRGYIAIFAGVFMIFYALSMLGVGFFKKFQLNPKFLTKMSMNASSKAKGQYFAPFITGLLNGLFIACGPLQAMYLYAAGTGSFIKGSTGLAVFGLGTLPIMLGFGSLATVISHNTTKKILKFSAIIVLVLGLIMLNRGLTLSGSSLSFDSLKEKITGSSLSPAKISGGDSNVKIVDGKQEITMDVDGSGYSPNSFVLKKGIPVKWNINVKELTSCNSEIIVNDYKIDKNLKQGLNVIEFTPDKTGTIRFSCGMGMLRGSFIVTDTGTASNEQIKAETSSKGMTCNMGSNGGGCGCGSR